jgi:hypothetical protein
MKNAYQIIVHMKNLPKNKSCIGCIAWHGILYFFLKSLRSLEEFRKNPHVKIPPKSPSTNFQSLAIIKNHILFGKEFVPSLSAQSA